MVCYTCIASCGTQRKGVDLYHVTKIYRLISVYQNFENTGKDYAHYEWQYKIILLTRVLVHY